jgi:hypothetical protein
MIMMNYTLPEFVFLDGNCHLGNTLKSRDVMMHVRSGTVLEIIALETIIDSDFKAKTHKFEYTGPTGLKEQHLFALHFTMSEDDELPEIFERCRKWYCNYLHWEDQNILTDEAAKQN